MEDFDFDTYWVGRGKKFLDDSLENLKKTFERYRAYLNGLSLTTFVGGISLESFLQTTNPILYAGFIVPVILFQLAKLLFETDLSTPSLTRIDPRRPLRVRAAYEYFLNELRKKLKTGREVVAWITLVGIICIPTTLFLSLKESKETKIPNSEIRYYNGIAHVKAYFPNNEYIVMEFSGKYTKEKKNENSISKKEIDTVLVQKVNLDDKSRVDWKYHITKDKNFKPNRILLIYKDETGLQSKIKNLK